MRNKRLLVLAPVAALALVLAGCSSSGDNNKNIQSNSGVHKTQVTVPTGSDGLTAEQRNVRDRLVEDNKPGAIKYLYVISPYSGQVLIYSTVRGKVTSSGKRLSPYTVAAQDGTDVSGELGGVPIDIGGRTLRTSEVLQDDGTYGDSVPYIYWWDVRGVYHQHFFTGGQIIHISSAPITVKSVVINLETDQK
jgi:uncharacterized protein YcfL